ncbi:hypothetical protein [Paraburkholderia aspalathi]|uniref:Uncharacterized protein n=1 Tax=Paraburkholderia aspalathi TaxID=1324617 RepID=A0A1I7ER19_9BURK|nr:hypothetical protein [Paraburkholderia aspalathi]SFU26333.1 hypothetical protein SAMN05192563_105223 [Paraburkholderia aspalathi]
MSFYVTSSAEMVFLERWSIRQSDKGERHFVGHNVLGCDGRVSTPIRAFDPLTRTGTTASGSNYRLVGRAGRDSDAEYVWGIASRAWGIETWTDVTPDLVPDWRSELPLIDDDHSESSNQIEGSGSAE